MKILSKEFFISPDQSVLKGHFPGNPILPGVMLLNFISDTLSERLGRQCHIKKIIRHKFIKPVLPEFRICVECQLKQTQTEFDNCYLVNCDIFDQYKHLIASGQYKVECLPS